MESPSKIYNSCHLIYQEIQGVTQTEPTEDFLENNTLNIKAC